MCLLSQLSIMRGQLHGANGFLHQAIALAHQSRNTQAIIYTYSLVKALMIKTDFFKSLFCAHVVKME